MDNQEVRYSNVPHAHVKLPRLVKL